MDASGAVIQADAYSGGQGNARSVRQQVNPGNYTIQAFSLDNPGAYTLHLHVHAAIAGRRDLSGLPGGSRELPRKARSRAPPIAAPLEGVSQVYNIVLPQAGTLDLDMQSTEFVPLLTLRDAKDNRIVNDDNFGNFTDSHITADVPAGTYTVVAATGGLPGSYTFTWQVKAHDLRAVYPGAEHGPEQRLRRRLRDRELPRLERPAGRLLSVHDAGGWHRRRGR